MISVWFKKDGAYLTTDPIIVLSSGVLNVVALGATKTIDAPLVAQLRASGLRVIWVGVGVTGSDSFDVQSKSQTFLFRVALRLARVVSTRWFDLLQEKEFERYDYSVAEFIEGLSADGLRPTLVIGRNVSSLATFTVCRRLGIKTILHSQWNFEKAQARALKQADQALQLCERSAKPYYVIRRQYREYEIVDLIWTFSERGRDSFAETPFDHKVFVTPLGVDLDKFFGDPNSSKNGKVNEILFVGNLSPEKGILRVAKLSEDLKIPGLSLNLIGGVPLFFKSEMRRIARKLQQAGVKVSRGVRDPALDYRRDVVFVLPSYHESFGLVVLEAMASGAPVVVWESVGASELVEDGVSGYVVSSTEEFSDRCSSLLNNPSLRKRIGEGGVKAASKYSWKSVSDELMRQVEEYLLN